MTHRGLLFVGAVCSCLVSAPTHVLAAADGNWGQHWVNAWQGSPTPGGTFYSPGCPSDVGLNNQTVRNVLYVTAGGDRVRIRLSNIGGATPLLIGAASVGMAGSGAAVNTGSLKPLSFGGQNSDLQLIEQAHAAGLKIFGATLLPFGGSNAQYGGDYGTPAGEAQRQKLNEWIRTGGAFDGVIDFDKATRDPANPTQLLPAYVGDQLHPNDAGYAAMANAVDLDAIFDVLE